MTTSSEQKQKYIIQNLTIVVTNNTKKKKKKINARHFVENVFCRKCCNFKNIHRKNLRFEPPRGKTNNVVSEQVRHKLGCTSTEES